MKKKKKKLIQWLAEFCMGEGHLSATSYGGCYMMLSLRIFIHFAVKRPIDNNGDCQTMEYVGAKGECA